MSDVYKGDVRAGRLTRHPDRVEFAYLPGYRGEPVATTLPVTTEPVISPAGQLPPFFVGLLPEGRRLTALIRALKTSADDELTLLLAVGGDTVGDVRVVAEGSAPAEATPLVDFDDPTRVDFADLFRRSLGPAYDRTAIPGAQDKVSGRMITFPASGGGGPVIVKLDPPEYPGLTVNEDAMLAVAETARYPVPRRVLATDSAGCHALIVSRFDRSQTGAGLERHPVEDGCQALGRYPADKYNLDTVEVIRGLADRCSAPEVARLRLVERLLLSYLVGDGDLHARNLAIWRGPGGLWEPTPVYDLICTAVYGDSTLAAPLGGRERIREMGRNRFLEVCRLIGLPERATLLLFDRKLPVIAAAVAETLEGPVFDRFPTRHKVTRLLSRRANLLIG